RSSVEKRRRKHFCLAGTIGTGALGASILYGASVCPTADCPSLGTDALRDFSVENERQWVLRASSDGVSDLERTLAGAETMAGNNGARCPVDGCNGTPKFRLRSMGPRGVGRDVRILPAADGSGRARRRPAACPVPVLAPPTALRPGGSCFAGRVRG